MRGSPKSGFRKRKAIEDLSGRSFGKLLVTGFAGYDWRSAALWKCACQCGASTIIPSSRLRLGGAHSCGCVRRVSARETGFKNRKHGLCRTSLYRIWTLIAQRCENPSNPSYVHYGARGIKPCAFIRESAANLLAIVGPRPHGKSIDRIDNNQGYTCGKCPECIAAGASLNIHWATSVQQASNKRTTVRVSDGGSMISLKQWCQQNGVDYALAYSRTAAGWPLNRLKEPKRK